tara:strand:+ start:138 stop:989 length:852 start_codon:yes stop_codon:yes gene_type:complete
LNKNKIFYISDFFLSDILGGGELNDDELCKTLIEQNVEIVKIKTNRITPLFLNNTKHFLFIISNFMHLSQQSKQTFIKNRNYIIYEHDHKYLLTRNPALYDNFLAPRSHIVNFDFYKNAKKVFCQSQFHKKIILKNIKIENLFNVSGNLWSKNCLEKISILSNNEKKNKCFIMNSQLDHKNARQTVLYCQKKGYDYDLYSSKDYYSFLERMSFCDRLVFFPKTPETLSRVVVEARMLGLKTITNKKIGAVHEPWFKLKGLPLIKLMKDKKIQIQNQILETLNE